VESIWLPLIILFFVSVAAIELFLYGYRTMRLRSTKKAKSRLRNYSISEESEDEGEITSREILSDIKSFNRFLGRIPFVKSLHKLTVMAKAPYPVSVYILISLILALVGYGACNIFLEMFSLSLLIGTAGLLLPWGYLYAKKRTRMKKFERQLPEALGLVARSLRAGVSFSGALQHITENFDDPLGTEFGKTLFQINYGYSVVDALKNMAGRIDCPDLKFFVVAVALQGETGGNLAEISESIARVIRERFKFRDKVSALTAEGRLTAIVLGCLPFFVIGALLVVSPGYLTPLYTEPAGKLISGAALVMMGLGAFFITRIIDIDI
jgi:tight adherence protein B